MANAHTWCKKASLFGPGFFSFPVHVYRSSRKPAALLATATIPLPLLLLDFANIWASAQEAARVPEFTLACWPVRKLQVEAKTPFESRFSPLLFLRIASKQPFCPLPSLAIHLYFLERFYIAKWAVKEWWKTLLINSESSLKPFMDCIL